jgi:protoporphyrin/coproporphyrin ferrochelatase
VRRFLAEFLSDPMVVQLPRFLWLPILHGLVLNTRPPRSAEKYRLIWSAEGSPLAVHTARQAQLLARATGWRVEYAMRYGGPGVREVKATMPQDTLVLPLYPQYADSTTGSVISLLGHRERAVRGFHDHPAYIGALAALVKFQWNQHGRGEKLVMSFHGLPQRAVDRGDPYAGQCFATARLLSAALGLA